MYQTKNLLICNEMLIADTIRKCCIACIFCATCAVADWVHPAHSFYIPDLGRIQDDAKAGSEEDKPSEFGDDDITFFTENVQPILENRCLKCHGSQAEDLGGQFALISRRSILHGGDSGPAVNPENPDESLLLDAINYRTYEMPPDAKLSQSEIDILTKWVRNGIAWPKETADRILEKKHAMTPQVNETTKAFWSFQPVKDTTVPTVDNDEWINNDIDHFVLAKLKAAGLRPAPISSKQVLIRRLYYDLIGLPPTYEQVVAFLQDESENAYSELVDRLLRSPHYGEKWGRHWLDLVRYAESNSFERDGTKPFVWRYRDFVIKSFNDDKPYDQFLIEQLAGDELREPTPDSIVATGYYRLGQWDDEPADPKQALYDDLDDILATTSQAMLGLTINCARCHDHKIDPIPTKDYYQMLAFFRNVRRYGVRSHETVLDASSRQLEYDSPRDPKVIEKYEEELKRHRNAMVEIENIAKADFEDVEHEEFRYVENHERLIRKRLDEKTITQLQFDQYITARDAERRLKANPPHLYRVLCVKEHNGSPPVTNILIRGNPHVEGDAVEPAFLSVLSPPNPKISVPSDSKSSGRRLALAKWIASKSNPMTARVMANRIWQHHFGRGIVRSANDFGFQGDAPTHPELLDYLASQFMESGWSIKQLHRLILHSSSYRMSDRFNEKAYQKDPRNELFWRFDMRRLTAEEVRDSILAISGRLNKGAMFGPSVFPKLSREVLAGQSMPGNGWGKSKDPDTRRRSIYVHVKRSLRVPLLEAFDSADTDFTCPVRFNTTQPTQALALLNGEFVNSEAMEFAKVIAREHRDLREQVREILCRATQREPEEVEIEEGMNLIRQWSTGDLTDPENALALFCLTVFNLNEFVFVE